MSKASKKTAKRVRDSKGKYAAATNTFMPPEIVTEATKEVKLPKLRIEAINTDNEIFGDYVSDDNSFAHQATFIRAKETGEVGLFVGDGQKVVLSLGLLTDDSYKLDWAEAHKFSPKEARLIGETLIAMANTAKSAVKAQKAYLDKQPKKSKSKSK